MLMMLSQGLGEYGALSGGGGGFAGIADTLSSIEDTVRHAEPRTWVIVAIGLFVLWFLFLRR
jgi:hypothetical protein